MQLYKKLLLLIILTFLTVIVPLVIFEFINYNRLPKTSNYYVWQPNLQYFFYPNETAFHGIKGSSRFTINNLGYRGPEFNKRENEYRILVIGGSTSECLYLDDSEAWPNLLMENLKQTNNGKKVITMNIGKSGHGLLNHILVLKYLPNEYDPDLIIFLVGANDALYRLSRKESWKPFNESEYDNTEGFTFSLQPGYTFKSTLTYKIYRAIKLSSGGIKPQDSIGNTLIENRIKRQNAENWITENPDLNFALKDYENNINRAIELSKEKDSEVIFITQPTLWKNNLTKEENGSLWMTYDFGNYYYPIETMAFSIESFNNKLLEVCAKNREILCLDLDNKLPKTLDTMYDDMHFNENGSKLVASEISYFIKNNVKEFQ